MLWDTHMHTHFSGDSNADPAAMARSAIEKNLAGICITDHLDYDYPDEPDLFTIDFPQYEKGIRQLQADFSDSLNINFGIELGLLAALLAVMTAYFRWIGAYKTHQHFFNGPMAKQHRMALLTLDRKSVV